MAYDAKWWKEVIVYQLYPRSFKDSDGDGIGDLRGIISKLDYLKSLGIDAIWLNPIYSSPNDDNGYDISDYRDIMKDFGTMADFDELIKGMHDRHIKLVMDLVVNHSSDEHEWFRQSRSSCTSPYRDYYHWWPAEKGKPNYRYSLFDINHDAWQYDSATDAYYLHYFSRKQPDLNWENPKVRQEVYDIMKFWVAKGVDGFRMDAFQYVSKDTAFPAFPRGYEKDFVQYYAMVPPIHEYLKEMYREVYGKYDIMSVAEGAGRNFQDAHDLVDADRKELNMAYSFDAIDLMTGAHYSVLKLKNILSRWDSAFADKGWLSIFLANHDNSRMIDRIGNPSPQYRVASGKLLNTLLLTLRGTPYCYNGDELGMINTGFRDISEFQDIQTLNEYTYQKSHGGDLDAVFKGFQKYSRDNSRSPFQWDGSPNAGFTTGTPWLRVGDSYEEINFAVQDNDPNSSLNYFRKLVQYRKNNKELVYGKYELLDKKNPQVFAYTRTMGKKQLLVLLNMGDTPATAQLPMTIVPKTIEINNLESEPVIQKGGIRLHPWQAVIYKW